MAAIKGIRTFTVSPNIIYSLIKAQAGTLAKAVLECIMNSVDAGAESVTVNLTPTKLTVVDTGRGFTTRDEIEACFEVFGFEHNEGDRVYGQFGIGRAQLWNFCSTVWRTNTFSMDVDIKNRGLDYDLHENMPQFDGLSIIGKFYERMKTVDIMAFEREIAELAAYAQVPVTVNGKLISKDPSQEKWTHETADAWIRLKETGALFVYNLGVKVRSYSAWDVGSGGLVVTKPGVRLALNMARNDILVSECAVWKRIKPFLQKQSDERIRRKSTKLTEDELQNLVRRFLAGEVSYAEIASTKLITDIQGKRHTLDLFLGAISLDSPATVAAIGTQLAERGHMLKYAFVLAPVTLTRFAVDTPLNLGEALQSVLPRHLGFRATRAEDLSSLYVNDYHLTMKSLSDAHVQLKVSEYLPEEQALIKALANGLHSLQHALRRAGVTDNGYAPRTRQLSIGLSETALAWTDGTSRITLARDLANKARLGLPGILAIAAVLVHEFLHETGDTHTHEHDFDFYDRYHRVMVHRGAEIGEFVTQVYRYYIRELRVRKLKVLTRQIDHLDQMDDGDDVGAIAPVVDEPMLKAA